MSPRHLRLTLVFIVMTMLSESAQAYKQWDLSWTLAQGGIQSMRVSTLNDQHGSAGIPEFDRGMVYTGGNLQAKIHGFIVGVDGGAYFGQDQRNGTYAVSLTGNYFVTRTGYAVIDGQRLRVYPLIGIGAARLKDTITDHGTSPPVTSRLTAWNMLLDISVEAQYLVPFYRKGNRDYGIDVRVQTGYRFSPIKREWEHSGSSRNVPIGFPAKMGVAGPFVSVSMGIYGRKQ
jgi:hypothetical protein